MTTLQILKIHTVNGMQTRSSRVTQHPSKAARPPEHARAHAAACVALLVRGLRGGPDLEKLRGVGEAERVSQEQTAHAAPMAPQERAQRALGEVFTVWECSADLFG